MYDHVRHTTTPPSSVLNVILPHRLKVLVQTPPSSQRDPSPPSQSAASVQVINVIHLHRLKVLVQGEAELHDLGGRVLVQRERLQ